MSNETTTKKTQAQALRPMADLLAALAEPLSDEDVKKREGSKEYVKIGHTIQSLWTDVGALGWDWEITHYPDPAPPRHDVREKIDRRTGAVLETEEGWTAFAWCMGKLTVRYAARQVTGDEYVEVGECVRTGVGAASSDMQPYPEMAMENAIKAAASDALKRAAVALGPKYGLALLFKEDEARKEGLRVRSEAEERARAARAAQPLVPRTSAPTTNKPPAASVAPISPPGGGAAGGVQPAARTEGSAPGSASPATKQAPSQAGPTGSGPPTSGTVGAGAVAPPAPASLPADEVARLAAKAAWRAGTEPKMGAVMADEQEAVKADAAGADVPPEKMPDAEKKPDPPAGAAEAPTATAPSASSSVSATGTTDPDDPQPKTGAVKADEQEATEARLALVLQCLRGDVPPEVTAAFNLGLVDGDELPPGLNVTLPPDPTADDLKGAGWSGVGCEVADLCALGKAEPVVGAVSKALGLEAVRRLGDRQLVGRLWKRFVMGTAELMPNGYNARLFAACVAHLTPKGKA